jgi:hypothetical protein
MAEVFEKRNWKIYFEWVGGKEYKELAVEFGLSPSTIKEICHKHLPPSIVGKPGLSANAYKKFREWKRGTSSKDPTPKRQTEKPLKLV